MKTIFRKAEPPQYTLRYLCEVSQLHTGCDVDMPLPGDAGLPDNHPKTQNISQANDFDRNHRFCSSASGVTGSSLHMQINIISIQKIVEWGM